MIKNTCPNAGTPSAGAAWMAAMGAERALRVTQNDVVDIHECVDVGIHGGLLQHLALGRGPSRLARLDVPAGQAPQSLECAFGAHDEKHSLAAKYGSAGAASGPGTVAAEGFILGHGPQG